MVEKYSRKYLIETAIGLQAVDGLKNSKYFNEQVSQYVNGEISFEELICNIDFYYEQNTSNDDRYNKLYFSDRKKRIVKLISWNPKIKIVELADKLGISIRTTKYEIESLKNNKILERINGNRYGYWKVNV